MSTVTSEETGAAYADARNRAAALERAAGLDGGMKSYTTFASARAEAERLELVHRAAVEREAAEAAAKAAAARKEAETKLSGLDTVLSPVSRARRAALVAARLRPLVSAVLEVSAAYAAEVSELARLCQQAEQLRRQLGLPIDGPNPGYDPFGQTLSTSFSEAVEALRTSGPGGPQAQADRAQAGRELVRLIESMRRNAFMLEHAELVRSEPAASDLVAAGLIDADANPVPPRKSKAQKQAEKADASAAWRESNRHEYELAELGIDRGIP